jgi:hypothetical protein
METIESQNESFTELETPTTPNKSPNSYLCNECGRTFQSMPGLGAIPMINGINVIFVTCRLMRKAIMRDILILMGI